MKKLRARHAGLASQVARLRPGTKMPMKVIAPRASPARFTASESSADWPEQPCTIGDAARRQRLRQICGVELDGHRQRRATLRI
jgi:hypothetical protein